MQRQRGSTGSSCKHLLIANKLSLNAHTHMYTETVCWLVSETEKCCFVREFPAGHETRQAVIGMTLFTCPNCWVMDGCYPGHGLRVVEVRREIMVGGINWHKRRPVGSNFLWSGGCFFDVGPA